MEEHRFFLEKELGRIVESLRGLGAKKVILFGSYARGRADLLTDLDLMVVLDDQRPFVERVAYLYAQLAPRVAVDILAYTSEEWERIQGRPFVEEALREGRILYEEPGN